MLKKQMKMTSKARRHTHNTDTNRHSSHYGTHYGTLA